MYGFLRQSTAATVSAGPFLAPGDGVTPKTALSAPASAGSGATAGVALVKAGVAAGYTLSGWAHDRLGYYAVNLASGDTDTVGRLRLEFVDAANFAPVHMDFVVLSAAVYDWLFGATAPLVNGTNAGPVAFTQGVTITQSTANGDGLSITGNGTGSGVRMAGGATGAGLFAYGGGANLTGTLRQLQAGFRVVGGTNGNAIDTQGDYANGGSGLFNFGYHGIVGEAYSAGAGIYGFGDLGNCTGMLLQGVGTGAGLSVQGGATGPGLALQGGSTSGAGFTITTTLGDGLSITPTAGNAIVATANGTSKHGFVVTGGTAGVSDGLKVVAGNGGADIRGSLTGSLLGSPVARNQDAVTAPTYDDCLVGAWTEAFGKEPTFNSGSWVKQLPNNSAPIRTFTLTTDGAGNVTARA